MIYLHFGTSNYLQAETSLPLKFIHLSYPLWKSKEELYKPSTLQVFLPCLK